MADVTSRTPSEPATGSATAHIPNESGSAHPANHVPQARDPTVPAAVGVDGVDGGEAAETVTFGLDGATTYDIDLSKKNAAAFRKSLARYVDAARRSTASSRSTPRKAAPSTNRSKPKRGFDILQLREWAGANKVAVPARGRIPNSGRAVEQAGGR